MSKTRGLLIAASGLFAVVPGVATLREGLLAPPEYEGLFSGLTVALGSFVLLLLAISRRRVARVGAWKLLLLTTASMAVALVAAFIYIDVRSRTIIPVAWQDETDPAVVEEHHAFLPLCPTPDGTIARELAKFNGNRHEFAAKRFSNIKRWIGEEPMWRTTDLLLALQLVMCSAITLAFGLLGFGGEAIENTGGARGGGSGSAGVDPRSVGTTTSEAEGQGGQK